MIKKVITLDKSLLTIEGQTFADGTSTEAQTLKSIDIVCKNPFFPYDESGDFTITLKAGENEVEFESQDHINSFIVATTSEIMAELISIGDEASQSDTKTTKKATKSTSKE